MEISNKFLGDFFLVWMIAYVVGLTLIFWRKDFEAIIKDISRFIYMKNLFGFFASVLLMVVVYAIFIPISIPFSIKNILNNLKNKRND